MRFGQKKKNICIQYREKKVRRGNKGETVVDIASGILQEKRDKYWRDLGRDCYFQSERKKERKKVFNI